MTSSSVYTNSNNLLEKATDSRGYTTTYEYNGNIYKQLGTPRVVTDAKGNSVVTARSSTNGRVSQSYLSGKVSLSYTYGSDGTLTKISRTSYSADGSASYVQDYNLAYTSLFDRLASVKVGSRTLASYEYFNNNSGPLKKMTYGNGDYISYEYDELERISKISYNDRDPISYFYNGQGGLGSVSDAETDHSYYYNYDSLGRLVGMTEQRVANNSTYGIQSFAADYDNANRVSAIRYRLSPLWDGSFESLRSYAYSYSNTDGTLTGVSGPEGRVAYSYDNLNRLQWRTSYYDSTANSAVVRSQYSYLAGANSGTTALVSSLVNRDKNNNLISSFSYTYDEVGNIKTVTETIGSDSRTRTYTYDAQGQMLSETVGGTANTYTYDGGGNIRSKKVNGVTTNYTYGNGDWKDLLTKYGDTAINYDSSGNPTNWPGISGLTWETGRQLMSATTTGGKNLTFSYDMDGLRLTKKVGSTEHKYIWQGDRLVSEAWGNNTLEFFYDGSGAPYAFKYNDDVYYYVTNLQGDIVEIRNQSGAQIATYTYDAWGRLTSAEPADGSVGNP